MSRAPDPMLYFVLTDFGKHGRSWVERDVGDMDRATTVRDIRTGQITNVIRVLECSLEGPICRDVTEDILGEVSFDRAMTAIDEVLNFDHQAARFDHSRDLRKHLAVV